ncbi:MAG: KH domain-containing protein [Candidatus Peregrinibacteria bacterium]
MADDISTGPDKDFVEYVVKSIVSKPEKVTVTRTVDDMGVLLTLQVAKEDMGKVIGKGGQTAKSIRILLRVIGSKSNARVNMKIVEPEGGEVMGGELEDDSAKGKSIMDEDLEV